MMSYEEFAKDIAKEASEILRNNFSLGMKKEWKSDHSPVTESDYSINQLLIDKVKKEFPTHNVKGEEQSHFANQSEYLWVCDPVDGTIPFSHGVATFTFSLALVKDGEPIIGIVVDPIMNRTFFAERGKGCYLNAEPIKVSNIDTLPNSLVSIENFDSAKFSLYHLEEVLAKLHVKVTKLCSIIYPSVLVASGEYLGTIFPNVTNHDAAAVKIIVEEAGGKVTDLFGNEQRYDGDINGFIASNGKVHDQLVELVGAELKKNG